MISSCFTLSDTLLKEGISGEYLGLPTSAPVSNVDVSVLCPGEDSGPVTLGAHSWEALPLYEETEGKPSKDGCLILLPLRSWIPCTERRDESFLLDVFPGGLGMVFCPKEATLLKNVHDNTLLVVDKTGTPSTDLVKSLPSIPKTIEGMHRADLILPKIPAKLGLSVLLPGRSRKRLE